MFHAKNGWYFERTVDGGMHIVKKASAHENAPIIAQLYIDHFDNGLFIGLFQ